MPATAPPRQPPPDIATAHAGNVSPGRSRRPNRETEPRDPNRKRAPTPTPERPLTNLPPSALPISITTCADEGSTPREASPSRGRHSHARRQTSPTVADATIRPQRSDPTAGTAAARHPSGATARTRSARPSPWTTGRADRCEVRVAGFGGGTDDAGAPRRGDLNRRGTHPAGGGVHAGAHPGLPSTRAPPPARPPGPPAADLPPVPSSGRLASHQHVHVGRSLFGAGAIAQDLAAPVAADLAPRGELGCTEPGLLDDSGHVQAGDHREECVVGMVHDSVAQNDVRRIDAGCPDPDQDSHELSNLLPSCESPGRAGQARPFRIRRTAVPWPCPAGCGGA